MAFLNIHSSYFAHIASSVLSGYLKHVNIKESIFSHTGKAITLNSFTKHQDSRRIEVNSSINIQQTVFESVLTQELDEKGGALCTKHCSIALWSCFFSENRAETGAACAFLDSYVDLIDTNFSRNYASRLAGAIYHTGQQFSIDRCNIQKCESERNVGALYSEAIFLLVQHSIFYHNRAFKDAGCIRLCNSSSINFRITFFIENQCISQYTGAAIDLRASNATFVDCSFTNNLVNGEHFPIYLDSKSSAIMSSSCINNSYIRPDLNMTITFGSDMTINENKCIIPDFEIPEIQEEFPIESNAQSTLGSWQFYLTLSFLIAIPIAVILLLPDLNIFY